MEETTQTPKKKREQIALKLPDGLREKYRHACRTNNTSMHRDLINHMTAVVLDAEQAELNKTSEQTPTQETQGV